MPRVLVVALLLLGWGVSLRDAAAEGWSLRRLNPFTWGRSDADTSPYYSPVDNDEDPTLWQGFTAGTRRFFRKTGDFLRGRDQEEESRGYGSPWQMSSSGSGGQRKPKRDGGFLGGLFGDDQDDEPRTVSEWLGQERPEP